MGVRISRTARPPSAACRPPGRAAATSASTVLEPPNVQSGRITPVAFDRRDGMELDARPVARSRVQRDHAGAGTLCSPSASRRFDNGARRR